MLYQTSSQHESTMRRVILNGVACFSAFLFAGVVQAEISIEELIADAGLREGPVAVRDLPGWKNSPTIILRGDADLVAGLQDAAPAATFIAVQSQAEALERAADADVVIGFCDEQVVNAATHLVWVQVNWAGVERCLATPQLASGEVLLSNMQKMSSPVIAEHAIAMMFSLTRGLIPYAKTMTEGAQIRFDASVGMTTVSGKTMLVVGLGGIGNEVAWRAAALGMRVVGTRNSSREGPEYVDYVGLSHELLELASKADVIVNALPLTPTTTGLFDKAFFNAAKHGALFINVGRGRSVLTDDLVAALENGQLGGVGLDVTEPEPLPTGHPLWQLQNVIVTPHVAASGGNRERSTVLLRENLRRYSDGEALLNVVDPARGY